MDRPDGALGRPMGSLVTIVPSWLGCLIRHDLAIVSLRIKAGR
jgi:hypothetical protein